MMQIIINIVVMSLHVLPSPGRSPEIRPLSTAEATAWSHHLVPLPKQIDLTASIVVPVDRVAISAPARADLLVTQAVRELHEVLDRPESEVVPSSAVFTITFVIGGDEALALDALGNADQAYRIIPEAEGTGLRLVARTPLGLYYASKTLQQLIRARATGQETAMPVVEITDWPDMATRGVWGVDASSHVRWLSDRKFNYMEQIASCSVDSAGKPVASLAEFKQRMIADGPSHGISPVPAILHLEQIGGGGLLKQFPELKGKGEGIHEGAICYSNPAFADILAQWIVGYLDMPGVREVDVWMAENLAGKPGCQCDRCKDENRDLLELQSILAAWKKAGKQKPAGRLSVLTSEETDDSNEQVLSALPADIRFWYYHSLLTYNTSRTPMVPGYLAEAGARGRDVGVCLNLSPHSTNYQPMTGVQFIHYRMTEFVSKKIPGMLGYPTPRVMYYPVNTEAAAEWAWNAGGRAPREFACAWAVRAGKDDPELFADWAMTHGEVAWDVYGSEYPAGEARKATGKLSQQLLEGKLPELGFVLWGIYPKPWGQIKSVEQLHRDVALAERAVNLARRMDDVVLLQESLTVQGYIESLKALYELKQIVTPDGVAEKDQDSARRFFEMYLDALDQARTHLAQWEMEVSGNARPGHTRKVCELLGRMIEEMAAVADDLGMKVQASS